MITHHATALNLASLVEHPAQLTPDRVAMTFRDMHMTFGELDGRASQVAAGLRALGVGPGDHIALSCPNIPWFPVAYFGILKAGGVVVPLNVLLKPREIVYHLADSDAKALLAFEGTPELPMGAMAKAACDEVKGITLVIMTTDPAAESPIAGVRTITQLMHGHPPRFGAQRRRPDDTAVILYTSGTTGHPKGAELTHANMLLNAIASRDMMLPALSAGREQDAELITLPLFHSTAQTCQMNASLYGGFRMVLLPRFDPPVVLDTMRREKIALWVGVPTMYWTLLKYIEKERIDPRPIAEHLRLCISGGAPMPVEVMQQFERTFGVRVLEGYGLSETSPVACFNQIHRPSKPGTVGQPIFGVEVRCVDDQGRPVAVGERGEVIIRGPNVMKAYYKRTEATDDAMRHGWFHTGDIGTLDADGYLSIVDRKKDMILRAGFNVYPRELEDLMITHPGVSLVAVVGVPDERLGEEVMAYVVRKPEATVTEDELIAWCRERVAAYKYPRRIEFRDTLPMGATGKILKRALKQEA